MTAARSDTGAPSDGATRCVVVHPHLRRGRGDASGRPPEARLFEAVGLAAAISLDVVARRVVGVTRVRPATLLGQGAVDEIGRLVRGDDTDPTEDGNGEDAGAALVVVDAALSPVQQRNLEKAWNCKVIDRTGLILEIFGERAATREGRLQVELASLTYQRSRLVRSWTHLERQRGGLGFVGGPGETQIEADRRMLDERITRLKRELADVKRTRDLHRKARRKVPYPIVALVGYTNAGKSTLFNRLTRAEVLVKDQLFATLDPTMRAIRLPSGRLVILSDTVGFVSDLPHELVAAFHATLEEVLEADVIVHVRDVSHPDTSAQKSDVEAVLAELGVEAGTSPLIEALNKLDRLTPSEAEVLRNQAARDAEAVRPLSALSGEGVDGLLAALDARLSEGRRRVELSLPVTAGDRLAWLYRHAEVERRDDDGETIHLSVRIDEEDLARFEAMEAKQR